MAHRTSLSLLAIYPLAFFLPIAALADSAEYFYDDQRRLTSVTDRTGTTAVYNYDAVGNLLSIDRLTPPGSGIGIYLMNPITGSVTQLCRVQGYGFDPVPSNNVVKFNGVTATVSSATAYTLTVLVPARATTGTVTVANTNGTANTSFSPEGPVFPYILTDRTFGAVLGK